MDDDFADLKRDLQAAQSAAECSIAADMAVVARALAEEGIEPEKAETIMRRIYDVAASRRGEELMQAILETAYREREPRREALSMLPWRP